jgi:hypothetical protein
VRRQLVFLSLLRVILVAAILFACLALALAVGLGLAELGYLGTCQDGTCQLVAAIYVMPLGGVALYLVSLVAWSIKARRAP